MELEEDDDDSISYSEKSALVTPPQSLIYKSSTEFIVGGYLWQKKKGTRKTGCLH